MLAQNPGLFRTSYNFYSEREVQSAALLTRDGVRFEELDPLPEPMAGHCLRIAFDKVVVAGGSVSAKRAKGSTKAFVYKMSTRYENRSMSSLRLNETEQLALDN